jgi:hypothetical protein
MRKYVAPLASDRAQTSDDELATAMLHADIAISQVPPDDATGSPGTGSARSLAPNDQ